MKRNSRILIYLMLSMIIIAPFAYVAVIYNQSYAILHKKISFQPPLSSKVYDRNNVLIADFFSENRSYLKLTDVPDDVCNAFITAEDNTFYYHHGIDETGIIRAFINNVLHIGKKQGGSTITQQLVKQIYTKGEKNLSRKLLEFFLVKNIEDNFNKNQILEMYLNKTYFGHGAYGLNAAARFYFNKSAKDLNPVEGAILAGIPPAPGKYSPARNPRESFNKSKQILANMINNGYINRQDGEKLFENYWIFYKNELMLRSPTESVHTLPNSRAQYFIEEIRSILLKQLGEEELYQGGYSIYTTLDLGVQEKAETLLKENVMKQRVIADEFNRKKINDIDFTINEKRGKTDSESIKTAAYLREKELEELALLFNILGLNQSSAPVSQYQQSCEELLAKSQVEGAFVAISLYDGGIIAQCGGSEFNVNNQLNRAAVARRQPGSAFKPFVYSAALESGSITAATQFFDAPILNKSYERNKSSRNQRAGKDWSPLNYDSGYHGIVLSREAFYKSLNIVPVLIYEKTGGASIINMASKLCGIDKSRFTNDPTLALGSSELTPLELTRGISVFANDGESVVPFYITRIIDSHGREIFIHKNSREKVLSQETAYTVTSFMRDVIDKGTGYQGVRIKASYVGPIAGKTGTNTGFRDAWFTGFNDHVAATVWLGCDSQRFSLGNNQAAAVISAPLWGELMKTTKDIKPEKEFSKKPNGLRWLEICSESGYSPNTNCPVKMELFRDNQQPEKECDGYHPQMLNLKDLIKQAEDQNESRQ